MFPAAHYVDKIAKGASLSSWVNLKVIKALGIALPSHCSSAPIACLNEAA